MDRAIVPAEICGHIVGFLDDDCKSLKSCSLVCKAWLPRSSAFLFCVLTLDNGIDVADNRSALVYPRILLYTRRLHCISVASSLLRPSLRRINFPRLESLFLEKETFWSLGELDVLLKKFQPKTELKIKQVTIHILPNDPLPAPSMLLQLQHLHLGSETRVIGNKPLRFFSWIFQRIESVNKLTLIIPDPYEESYGESLLPTALNSAFACHLAELVLDFSSITRGFDYTMILDAMSTILEGDIPLNHLQSLETLTFLNLSFLVADELYFPHLLTKLCSPRLRHIQWDFAYEDGAFSYLANTKDSWEHLDNHLVSMPSFELFSVHMTVDDIIPSLQDVLHHRNWLEWLLDSLNHRGTLNFLYP